MRIRTKGSPSYQTKFHTLRGSMSGGGNGSIPEPTYPQDFAIRRSSLETMTDTVSPGYFKAVRNGSVLPVNPCTSSGYRVGADSLDAHIITHTHGVGTNEASTRHNQIFSGCFPYDTLSINHATVGYVASKQALLQDSLSRARSHAWDIGTMMAELSKTRVLVGGAAVRTRTRMEKILDAMSRRRRSKRPNFGELSREFSEIWLENRYGWRLLYYDLKAAQESYDKISQSDFLDRVRGRASDSSSSVEYTPWVRTGFNSSRIETRLVRTTTLERRAATGVTLNFDNVVSVDPVVTAYELIPFSFVLDWFTTVGSVIEGFSPFVNSSVDFNSFSERRFTTVIGEVRAAPQGGENVLMYSGNADFFVERYNYNRTTENVSALPRFRLNLNWAKGVDILALSTLIVSRKTRALRRMATITQNRR